MSVVATCPAPCGQKNRLKPGVRQKCGKCGHEFTPREVMVAALGERPGIPLDDLPPPMSDDPSDSDEDAERCGECDRKICEECGDCHKCSGSCD